MPCRCAERRQWIKTRIVDPATGKLVQVLKTLKDPTMSLTERLRKIEADIAELKQHRIEDRRCLEALVSSLEDEAEQDEEQAALTLDGESAGGERDQSQGLDG
jgi:hypothetical protein